MSNTKLTTAESISIVLTILVAHTLVLLPRNLLVSTKSATIINLIYVGIIVISLAVFIVKLFKNFPGSDIIDISEYLGGSIFKKIIGIIFIFYFIFSASILLRNFCECLKVVYYPTTNILFIILAFVVTVCFVSKCRFESIAKVNLIILPIVLFTVVFLFIGNLGNFEINNFFPILGDGIFNTFITGLGNLVAFGGICMLYFLPPYLKEPEKFKKISIISIGIAIVYLILCVSILLFMFSFLMDIDEIMPLYTATRYIDFGTFFQRLESFLLLFWMIEIACYITICMMISIMIFKKITNLSSHKTLIIPFGLLIFFISLLPQNSAVSKFLENTVYKYLIIAIVFVLSITILIISNMKKNKFKGEVNIEKNI